MNVSKRETFLYASQCHLAQKKSLLLYIAFSIAYKQLLIRFYCWHIHSNIAIISSVPNVVFLSVVGIQLIKTIRIYQFSVSVLEIGFVFPTLNQFSGKLMWFVRSLLCTHTHTHPLTMFPVCIIIVLDEIPISFVLYYKHTLDMIIHPYVVVRVWEMY